MIAKLFLTLCYALSIMSFKSARLLGHYQHLDAAVTLLEDCSNVYLQLPYYIFLPSVL